MSTCFLHVPDPDDQPFDDDEPNKPIAPGDRWCSLWAPREPGGPRLPCHPSIEGTADKWLLIAGAIEAGAPRAFGRVAFAPAAGGGELWSPHNSTGDRDHVRLTTAELVELAADIRAKLAPPDRDLKPDNLPAAPCPYDRVPYDRVPGYVEGRGCPVCKGIGMTHLTVAPDPDVIASAPRPTVADQPAIDTLATSDPVALFIDGHAKRLAGPGWDDLDSDEQSGWASEVHDVLNNLRADEHGEVFDGRPGMAVPTGPESPPANPIDPAALAAAWYEDEREAGYWRHDWSDQMRAGMTDRAARVLATFATPPTLPADLRGLLDALVAAKDAIDASDLHDLGHILRLEVYEDAVRAVAEWHRGAGDVDAEPAPAPLSDGELISLWGQYVGSPPSPNGMTLMRAIRDHAGGGR